MAAEETTPAELQRLLEVQKAALRERGPPSVRERERRLDVMVQLLLANEDALVAAVTADFGVRPREVTRFADVLMALEAFKAARAGVRSWCRPERRRVDFPFNVVGATNYVEYQPKGVVGVIAPWNYPIMLLLTPVASAFAAGDAVLLKPSELAPRTALLIARLVNGAYDESIARVVLGGPRTSAALAALPLDHLVFTGSTRVGKLVAAACAQNLTPTTLELGGKCPVIVGRRADVDRVREARRPRQDFEFRADLPRAGLRVRRGVGPGRLRQGVRADDRRHVPGGVLGSGDYASIISDAHGDRLRELTAEATRAGCRVVECRGGAADDANEDAARRVAPTLILDAGDALRVSSEEIFGPLLVVRTYARLADALSYIAARPKPLALYYLGPDRAEERRVLDAVASGGVTVNDTVMHCGQEDLPFGGVGASGHGRTRGRDGFRELSNVRGVHRQIGHAGLSQLVLDGLYPPYDRRGTSSTSTSGSRCARCARPGAASCDARRLILP